MKQPITTAIIPAAGFGTRFAPMTSWMPKELLPLDNRPALEYILEEYVANNITNIHTIISPQKKLIKKYCEGRFFTGIYENLPAVQHSKKLLNRCTFSWHYQNIQAGLADALLCAQHAIKEEFFVVSLPDEFFTNYKDLHEMMTLAHKYKAHVVAVQEVAPDRTNRYGIIAPHTAVTEQAGHIHYCIEKPSHQQAPSNLALVGRYVFHTSLFTEIRNTPPTNNEILLPETLNKIIKDQQMPILYYKIQGSRFDTGTPETWRECIIKK